jgi:DNA invertase Pin-like site-specific DNA recombinase
MVRERTRAGLKAAAARGRKGGRQPKLTPEHTAQILDGLGSRRKSAADLARLFWVHRATISRLRPRRRSRRLRLKARARTHQLGLLKGLAHAPDEIRSQAE